MPDNTLVAKDSINEVIRQLDSLQKITINNSKEKGAVYRILEKTCEYAGHTLSLAVCYSESIRATKEKTLKKAVVKEAETISCAVKTLSKRDFACEEDASLEIAKLNDKTLKKVAFHDVTYSIRKKEKRRRGRPSKSDSAPVQGYKYFVDIVYSANEQKITEAINQASCFVLCSNESPQRIEAFCYLMLLCMLMLSLAEYVVRRGLQQDNDVIIGPENRKIKRPTQRTIYEIFFSVRIRVVLP